MAINRLKNDKKVLYKYFYFNIDENKLVFPKFNKLRLSEKTPTACYIDNTNIYLLYVGNVLINVRIYRKSNGEFRCSFSEDNNTLSDRWNLKRDANLYPNIEILNMLTNEVTEKGNLKGKKYDKTTANTSIND